MRKSPTDTATWAVHLDVVDQLVRYLAALDGKDWAAAGGCFTADGTLRFGDVVMRGPATIIERTGRDLGAYTRTQHQISNPVADVAGEPGARTATLVASCIGAHIWDEGRSRAVMGGDYAARLAEQPDGTWRLSDLNVSFVWQMGDDDPMVPH